MCISRQELVFENLALCQQVTALKQERPKPRLHETDRGFWVALGKTLPSWPQWFVIVTPETVVDWNRRRFSRFWRNLSRQHRRPGRPPIDAEIRELIRRMVRENRWVSPRIHSELKKLGFDVSEATVSRYVRRFCVLNRSMGIKSCRTVYFSPWQNPVVECWVSSCRREMFDHVVVLGRQDLVQLLKSYDRYYQEDRCHL